LTYDWAFSYVRLTFLQVVNEHGEPGTENEIDEPVGSQVELFSRM
jgi:hypothetical protein